MIVDMPLLVVTLPPHQTLVDNIDLDGVMIVIEDKSSLLAEGKMTSVKMMTILMATFVQGGYCK